MHLGWVVTTVASVNKPNVHHNHVNIYDNMYQIISIY